VLVSDRNFTPHASPTWRATVAKADVQVIAPPPRRPATDQHPTERTFLRRMRNHIETLIGLLKGQQGLGACLNKKQGEGERGSRARDGPAPP
jgi:hypothetical protein